MLPGPEGRFAAQHRAMAARRDGGGAFAMSRHIADVTAFIERLDAGPVHLVGHSRGAAGWRLIGRKR